MGGYGKGELTLAFFTYDWQIIELPNPNDNKLLIEYMERALNFPDYDVRLGAAHWLIKKNKRKYTESVFKVASEIILNRDALVKKLGEYGPSAVLQEAIWVLELIGDKASKDMIKKLVNDEDKFVANAAREALKELGEER